MIRISTFFISGLIALCFCMSLQAQSSQQDLDQAELMKQFIGTWGLDRSEDKTSLTDIIPSDQGYEMSTYKKGTGVNLWTWKALIGFDNIDEWVEAFREPRRDEWQKPEDVVKSINLKRGDVVADKLESYIYEAHRVKPDNPELEPRSVDIVFMRITYHDMENRMDYLKRLSKSLKKNGRVVIVDWYHKQLPGGFPNMDHTLSKEVVIEEFREAGYNLTQDKDFLQYQIYLEFELGRIGTKYIQY